MLIGLPKVAQSSGYLISPKALAVLIFRRNMFVKLFTRAKWSSRGKIPVKGQNQKEIVWKD